MNIKTIAATLVVLLLIGVAVWYGYLKKKLSPTSLPATSSTGEAVGASSEYLASLNNIVTYNGMVYGYDLDNGSFVTAEGAIYDFDFHYLGQASAAQMQTALAALAGKS